MYIKAKDGVYELKENMTIEKGVFSFFGKIYDTAEKHLFRNDKDLGEVVNQSENLDELCDEFVIVLENADGQKIYSINYALCEALKDKDLMIKVVRNKDLKYEWIIYGAVWCEFGLKYVAKLNSKGELELL